ncbi:hypothetical protein F5876DRAFT_70493 [Lentinula aff. lateritia]|uniref:Uncharacterized protein n=1 Tax=Lentinula aff. lateritia TaxID=2804960 RepID=A0ACC1TIV9_9AGAR|nr:hypothetical protein F5876DRAFT_70493 [Lentinula aff. lateritia]
MEEAEKLIHLTYTQGLEMILLPTIPTYRLASTGIWTRQDNVFLSEAAVHALVSCDVVPEEMTNGADHIPVSTILNLSLLQTQPSPKRNFRTINWETFNKHFAEELEKIPPPSAKYATTPNIDQDVATVIPELKALDENGAVRQIRRSFPFLLRSTIFSQTPSSEVDHVK